MKNNQGQEQGLVLKVFESYHFLCMLLLILNQSNCHDNQSVVNKCHEEEEQAELDADAAQITGKY